MGSYLIALAFGAWMVAAGMLDLPGLLFLTQTRLLVMLVILAVGEFAELTQPALASAARISAFLDKPPEKRQYEPDNSLGS